MSSNAPTYFHYRSGLRNSLSTKHFSDKNVSVVEQNSNKNGEKLFSNKIPEPLPRQSKSKQVESSKTSFSNKSTNSLKRHLSTSSMDKIQYLSNFPQRSRSRSADFEDMNNELNASAAARVAKENSEIRTFDRIQNYRLEKNFVTYTEQPANGFNGTFHSEEDLSPKTSPNGNSNTLPKLQAAQMTSGLRRTVQVGTLKFNLKIRLGFIGRWVVTTPEIVYGNISEIKNCMNLSKNFICSKAYIIVSDTISLLRGTNHNSLGK